MPPFQSRSTGARRIAWISSAGVIVVAPLGSASASAICGVMSIDFRLRGKMPPPSEISERS